MKETFMPTANDESSEIVWRDKAYLRSQRVRWFVLGVWCVIAVGIGAGAAALVRFMYRLIFG